MAYSDYWPYQNYQKKYGQTVTYDSYGNYYTNHNSYTSNATTTYLTPAFPPAQVLPIDEVQIVEEKQSDILTALKLNVEEICREGRLALSTP